MNVVLCRNRRYHGIIEAMIFQDLAFDIFILNILCYNNDKVAYLHRNLRCGLIVYEIANKELIFVSQLFNQMWIFKGNPFK